MRLELADEEASALRGLLEFANPTGGALRALLDKVLEAQLDENLQLARPRPRGPRLASDPVYKKIKCHDCGAMIEYLPEHVEEHHGRDYSGGPDGYKRVRCPRQGCKGHGYIERW